ncbi:hypothetical protein [Clostridium sp.]|uniref:hypothetical protein n=1 Tax=Clostridium sp. TaxID=1506 RepID=UPI001A497AFC|nr:hypothetical protein [Clostridium sp.]MBK5241433.1 hypothetical protein [Clostridium sp.]
MKTKFIKELTVVIIIITLSIIGIFTLNEYINYQLKINDINKFILAENFDEAEKSIRTSGLKFKDIDMLKEKIKQVRETQY